MRESIGKDWLKIGRNLGLKDPELDDINQRFKDLEEQVHQMLKLWKHRQGENATKDKLAKALLKAGRKDLHDYLKGKRFFERSVVFSQFVNLHFTVLWQTFPNIWAFRWCATKVNISAFTCLKQLTM